MKKIHTIPVIHFGLVSTAFATNLFSGNFDFNRYDKSGKTKRDY